MTKSGLRCQAQRAIACVSLNFCNGQPIGKVTDGVLNVPEANMKRFEYMVLGDADTEDGLIAPFDEEETKSLLHIETCAEQSLFDFWRAHANSDQVAGRTPELLAFKNGNQLDN
jgi:hypothetical protein